MDHYLQHSTQENCAVLLVLVVEQIYEIMFVMTQNERSAFLVAPEYWQGHDIFDESIFRREPAPGLYLNYENYVTARNDLRFAVGQVAAGNATEVRYGSGKEFNTDLPDGSLVVVDTEHIARWSYADPARVWEADRPRQSGPTITRPYSEFWLRHQDGSSQVKPYLGTEGAMFADKFITYSRILSWGVLATQGGGRWIQPFSFGATTLSLNGTVDTPRAHKRYPSLQGAVIPMPAAVGEVEVSPRLSVPALGYAIDSMERIRSIDVVYLAASRKAGKRQRARRFGVLALPKFGLAGA